MMAAALRALFVVYVGFVLYNHAARADPVVSSLAGSTSAVEATPVQRSPTETSLAPASRIGFLPGPLSLVRSMLAPVAAPLMFLGAAYYLFSFVPSALPTLLTLVGLKARLVPYLSSLGLRESLDLGSVGRQLETAEILERGLDVIDVPDGECRRRAACEVGQWLARSHPTIARVVDLFSGHVLRSTKYSDNLVQGARNNDCESLFPKCPSSPFRRFGTYL